MHTLLGLPFPFMQAAASPLVWLFFRSPAQGATTITWAAATCESCADEERGARVLLGGKFVAEGTVINPRHPRAMDDEVAAQLWALSETLTGVPWVLPTHEGKAEKQCDGGRESYRT